MLMVSLSNHEFFDHKYRGSMKIAVCIKQVPVLFRMRFDYENKTIVREGVPLEVNTFDLLAVDRAVELVKQFGGEVVVITMGPPQASDALVQCRAMGAHRGIHLTDMAMAGADTLATARTLAMAIRRESFDLVLCGLNSTDAETGQVGPEIAELLDLPFVGSVAELDYKPDDNVILVKRLTDQGYELVRCPLPALVSVTEGIMPERFPGRAEMQAAREAPAIEEVTALQLSADGSLFGASGSPTWVSDIQLIETERMGVVIDEPNPAVAASKVLKSLRKRVTVPKSAPAREWNRYPGLTEGAIWILAERAAGGIRSTTFEVLGKAGELAQETRTEVVALLLGGGDEEDTKILAAHGADRVLVLDGVPKIHPTGLAYTEALARAIGDRDPYGVLFASTPDGRALASRVAARLGLGLTGDCIDLEISQNGQLLQLKPALGGNVVAPILSRTRPYMATLRPGLLNPRNPDWTGTAEVEVLKVSAAKAPDIEVLESYTQEDARGLELEAARIVMGVGMGVGGPDNLPIIYELAGSIGATVAATRNVTDMGWLPKQVQVGLTGKAIAPELYIAVGIRGDFNHMVGLQKAGTIIAINNNPDPRRSPILEVADISIVGDWQTYLPPLVDALRSVALGSSD